MIKLIVSDMDGSLLTSKGELPPNFFDVLEKLHKKGIRFVVASGRSYFTLYENFAPKSDSIDYIADNGTCVVENGEITYKNVLCKSYVDKIIKACDDIEGLHIILCGSKGAYIKKDTGIFLEEINRYYKYRTIVDDLTEVSDEILKIGIYDVIGAQENSYKILSEKFSDSLAVVVSGSNWTDVMNKDANKGVALARIQ